MHVTLHLKTDDVTSTVVFSQNCIDALQEVARMLGHIHFVLPVQHSGSRKVRCLYTCTYALLKQRLQCLKQGVVAGRGAGAAALRVGWEGRVVEASQRYSCSARGSLLVEKLCSASCLR